MNQRKPIGVGIIGCGKISQAYFIGIRLFQGIRIVACADLNAVAAEAKAAENGCQALGVDALLDHPDIDIVLNLTIPAAHAEVSRRILEAGMHVYSEKPLTVDLEDARAVLEKAAARGLRVGCAPDTFFGAGIQTCREWVDSGELGRITSGTAFLLSAGPESWHPNPGFYYLKGGGPVFDMAPYYLTALVYLLGPIQSVSAVTTKAHTERTATSEARMGEKLPVEVNTHASATLVFESGAVITAVFSFDVLAADHSPIQLYGTEGSIKIPDPNTFGGPVATCLRGDREWTEHPLTRPYSGNTRGIGLADMAAALRQDRPHRASGTLAAHVLEVMHAFDRSSESGRRVAIQSCPEQPAALPYDPEADLNGA